MKRAGRITIAVLLVGVAYCISLPGVARTPSRGDPVEMKRDSLSMQTVQGWNLLCLPVVQQDMTPEGVFGDDFGEEFYSVYNYEGVASGYAIADSLVHGEGFWLNAVDSRVVTAFGRVDTSITTSLRVEWNLIGNPFPVRFNACDLQFTDGIETKRLIEAARAGWLVNAVYGYADGGYFIVNSAIEVWTGYWVSTLIPGLSIIYELNGESPSAGSSDPVGISETMMIELNISLETTDGEWITRSVLIGTHEGATDGLDPVFDAPMPPVNSEVLTAGIESDDRAYALFLRDIRSRTAKRWNLSVSANDAGRMRVWWSAADIEFAVREVTSGRVLARSEEGEFLYMHQPGRDRFTIELP